mgnify:FL=1
MNKFIIVSLTIFISSLFLLLFLVQYNYHKDVEKALNKDKSTEIKCMVGTFSIQTLSVDTPEGTSSGSIIGEQLLCGRDLSVSSMYGPKIESHMIDGEIVVKMKKVTENLFFNEDGE